MATFQKRGSRWRAIVRKAGHPAQSKTFSTKGRAQTWAKQVEAAIEDGLIGKSALPTVREIIELHLDHLEGLKDRGYRTRTNANTLERVMDTDVRIDELEYATLSEFCRVRVKEEGVSRSTALHDVMFLSGAVTTATLEGVVPPEIRQRMVVWCRGLARADLIQRSEHRDRRPTAEELERILAYTRDNPRMTIRHHDIIRFAIASSMRMSEILGLRRSDVDLEARTALIRARKHPSRKTDQLVPLLGESADILAAQPCDDERFFPFKQGGVSNGFRKICRAVGVEGLRFHDLRHEGISRLFEQGYQIQEVAMVSGHRGWHSLQRYANLRPGDLVEKDRSRKDRHPCQR